MVTPLRFVPVVMMVLAIGACGKSPPPAAAEQQRPRPVLVSSVAMTPRETAVTYSGTVQARVQANLAFRVGGAVVERPVDIGDNVKVGQLLARLDPKDLRLSLETAEHVVRAALADAANAQADFARYQRLGRGSPAYIPAEFDKRQAALDGTAARLAQAQRQLSLARDQLDYAELRADADGVITALPVEVGQVVAAGQTVAALAHTAATEIAVDVPENRLPDIHAATDITVALWSAPDKALHGRLREVGALADPASRTFMVKVAVLDPPTGQLGLGMTASVRFAHKAGAPVALLPAAAVVDKGGSPAVWVFDPARQRAALRPVRIEAWRGDGQAVVAEGLSQGDLVVAAGASLLDADLPVVAWAGPVR